jgi:hypothetical protein
MKLNHVIASLTLVALTASHHSAFADVVYITSRPNPSGSGAQANGTYTEFNLPTLGDFGAAGTALGRPATSGAARTYISSAFMTDTTAGVDLTPTLGVLGGTYQIDYNFNSVAGNTSTNIVMAVSCLNGTLSFATTDKMQRSFGNPANVWTTMGYLTNNPGSGTPTISFRYQSGSVSGAGTPSTAANRLLFDAWRFTLVEPCIFVPTVSVTGPLATNLSTVVVTGVSASATNLFVYQNSGAGMVLIGSRLVGVDTNKTVTVSGLVKGAQVAATQKINGQEGCVPTSGVLVGGGANPRIRAALSIRETTDTGPAGAPATATGSTSIHFLGSSALNGSSPAGGTVVNPGSSWQTVSFTRGPLEGILDSANVAGTANAGSGYNANDTVSIQVFPYRVLANGVTVYSTNAATSADVTSVNPFTVSWTWDAVPGAAGYKVLRNYNFVGYLDSTNVVGNSLSDNNTSWGPDVTVLPNASQAGRSVRWSPSTANTNSLPGQWGILESVNFVIDDLSDTGPYDLYIDNLRNGTTTWQTFEGSLSGAADISFRSPTFSGTTSGNLLTAPDQSVVSNLAADASEKSLRIRFQWSGTNSTRWLRLTTSGVGNPLVNLDDPISFRMLLLPVNTAPVQLVKPYVSINTFGADKVLTWTNAHRVQASSLVTGSYTNVPGAITSPWTNSFTESEKYFRLAD